MRGRIDEGWADYYRLVLYNIYHESILEILRATSHTRRHMLSCLLSACHPL